METNARYIWVGAFLLGVIGATFGFVFWLYGSGGLQDRTLYRIRFESSVSGLLAGSAVLFNGIRVGEVSTLSLDPGTPSHVIAVISVQSETPVRADTRADIDFQGFTGSPAVSLSGGNAPRGMERAEDGGLPMLVAAPNAGDDLTKTAARVLNKIDGVIDENAESLRSGIADLSTFANALSRNSNRVDGTLAGLKRMTGGGSKAGDLKI